MEEQIPIKGTEIGGTDFRVTEIGGTYFEGTERKDETKENL